MIITCGPKALLSYTLRSSLRFALLLSAFLLTSFGVIRTTSAATLVVPAGGNLQAALNSANPGDTIIREAGPPSPAPFPPPAKPASEDFITIQSSALSQLPSASQRVSPAHAPLMPKLLSPGNNQPALLTTPLRLPARLSRSRSLDAQT